MARLLKLHKSEELGIALEEVKMSSNEVFGIGMNLDSKVFRNLDLGGELYRVICVSKDDGLTVHVTNPTFDSILYNISGDIYIEKVDDTFGILSLTDEDITTIVEHFYLVEKECFVRVDEEKVNDVASKVCSKEDLVFTTESRLNLPYYVPRRVFVRDLSGVHKKCELC